MRPINKVVQIIANKNGFYLGFSGKIVGKCEFNGVVIGDHDQWFCGLVSIGDNELSVFVYHGNWREKNGNKKTNQSPG